MQVYESAFDQPVDHHRERRAYELFKKTTLVDVSDGGNHSPIIADTITELKTQLETRLTQATGETTV